MYRLTLILILALASCVHTPGTADTSADLHGARLAVESFYRAFNSHDFGNAATFSTEDWAHINPVGGWTRGRNNVLAELREVHGTFLKGTTDSVESMDSRVAGPGVVVVTAISNMSPFTTPDGVHHPNDRQIRTFVVVKRGEQWLILQDQNTLIVRRQ